VQHTPGKKKPGYKSNNGDWQFDYTQKMLQHTEMHWYTPLNKHIIELNIYGGS
jgi:hypothetical protein